MRRIIGLCLTVMLAWAGSPLAQAEDRALLIGVGQYKHARANLPGIDHDLEMMGEVVELLGFGPSQVRVVQDSSATLIGIKSAIRDWLINGVNPGDRALLYYSGHGSQIRDINGDESDQADEVLMPHDTGVADKTLTNVLVDDEFGQMLARIPAERFYVFLDACHSGTATKSFSMTKGLMDLGRIKPKFFVYEGMPLSNDSFVKASRSAGDRYVALTAARDNQTAVSSSQGSVFTYGLWAAIKQAAARNQDLSVEDLRVIIDRFIAKALSGTGRIHNPQVSGNMRMSSQKLGISSGQYQPAVRDNDLRQKLEALVARADYRLEVNLNRRSFRVGDELTLSCQVDRPGYLNILNIGPGESRATVVFPNRLHQENLIRAGGRVAVPEMGDGFVLRAHPPVGETLIVVIHTQKPINAYLDGQGGTKDLFKMLSAKSYRSFKPETRPRDSGSSGDGFGAAKIITFIE